MALERVLIARNLLNRQGSQNAAFDFQTSSRSGRVDLSQGKSYSLTISSSELKTIKFANVTGKPLAISYFEDFADPAELAKSQKISISREYLVNGQSTINFHEGDMVLVRLDPRFTNSAPDDMYQVVDYLPSNLKPIVMLYNTDLQGDNGCNPIWYPFKATDEAIYFNVGKWFTKTDACPHRTINFHARVVSGGIFRAQGAVIQSLNNLDVENISKESVISVK